VAEWKPRARGWHPLYNRLCGEFHNVPRRLAEMFHAARVATTSRPRPIPAAPGMAFTVVTGTFIRDVAIWRRTLRAPQRYR
jgi:hypothetical protein